MLFFRKKKTNNLYTVAFYNLENLFDTVNSPFVLDDDFTPKGKKRWNKKRYHKKLHKLSTAIANVGQHKANRPPSIVGVAEVENKQVVNDLVNAKNLKKHAYDTVHFDSPDERGIDNALIYRKEDFEVTDTNTVSLLVYNEEGQRDYTRDILHVTGKLNSERLHVLVNHWPSRRDGAEKTAYKRIEAAKTVQQVVNTIQSKEEDPNIIIMGDFNDDPHSESIKYHLLTEDLYNPMETLLNPYKKGSLNYERRWNLFDQIIFSKNFFDTQQGQHSFAHANIFDEHFLQEWKGRYKGNPFRTYVGKKYLGGYSDHFPVYIQLKKH